MRCLLVCLAIIAAVVGCGKKAIQTRAAPYDHWESASVKSNGVRIHYWQTGGEGKPVMIMAHGVTDYGLSWASLAGNLQGDYDIIKYDAKEENREKHQEIAALLANGKLVHIDGASHLVRLDKPKETEKRIRAFLAELK